MNRPVSNKLVFFIYLFLAIGTAACYWQVHNFDFINLDDHFYVYENSHILNGLTSDGIIWVFTTSCFGYWQPLTWLSLMLDCQLFGSDPGWMHLVSLFLHIANTLLLFWVLKKITGSLWPSAFVAALFAIHPMHVQSVAWIAERKDVLSTSFLMLTLAAYAGYVRKSGLVRYLTAILLFILGLLAKPMLVTLPFILLLLDYWPLNRFTLASDKRPVLYRIIIEKIPFFAVSAISSIVAFLTQKTGSGVVDIETIPFTERVGDGFVYYIKYIGKMFWPQDLAIVYSHNIANFAFWQIAICTLLLLAVSILVIRFGRNQKYLLVGWFWFAGTLIPVIGLVRFMGKAGGSFADRFTYIPYIGLFIMVAWGLPELLSKWRNRKIVLGVSMVIVLAIFGIYTHKQVSYWKNSLTVFSHALKVTQNNYVAYYGIGKAYGDMGRYREAVDAYKQVIRIRPNYAEAYNNLGNTYGSLGRYQESIDALGQAIKIKPHYADAYKNLGITYGEFGRYQEAIEAFKQAIKIEPDLVMAHNNLGIAYDELGRYKEAIEAYKQAIRIKPDYTNAHAALSAAYFKTGNRDSALKEYEIVKTLNPEMANKLYNYIYKSDK